MRTVKFINNEAVKALEKFKHHQNNCTICKNEPPYDYEDVECIEANFLYSEYEVLISESEYIESIFQAELKERNIKI